MRVQIRGRDLPGRTWCSDGEDHGNVHVGLQVRSDPVDLVPGDADSASWALEVRVKVAEDGALDFAGPAVHGRRGDRFCYLTWGDVGPDGGFAMFRRAKLMLDRVDPALVRSAEDDGQPLIGEVSLTDDRGGPRCARVDPPALSWSVG
ncbi:MAG TPA: DUF5990 family protein [Acidimicrobiales bacterium]